MSRGEGLVVVQHDFFPMDLFAELEKLMAAQAERKRQFRFDQSTPGPIFGAAQFLGTVIGANINTALSKRYRIEDNPPSRAYVAHPDPDEYSGDDIELCTVSGEAELYVQKAEGIQTIQCRPNTVVKVDPMLPHWVTPPQNPEGIREVLFFGFDHTQPATIDLTWRN